MDPDLDKEEMEDVILSEEIYRHWRMFFKGKYVGVEYDKSILHANIWDV